MATVSFQQIAHVENKAIQAVADPLQSPAVLRLCWRVIRRIRTIRTIHRAPLIALDQCRSIHEGRLRPAEGCPPPCAKKVCPRRCLRVAAAYQRLASPAEQAGGGARPAATGGGPCRQPQPRIGSGHHASGAGTRIEVWQVHACDLVYCISHSPPPSAVPRCWRNLNGQRRSRSALRCSRGDQGSMAVWMPTCPAYGCARRGARLPPAEQMPGAFCGGGVYLKQISLPPCRYDESDDGVFYDVPRFVTHIDDAAISSLTK